MTLWNMGACLLHVHKIHTRNVQFIRSKLSYFLFQVKIKNVYAFLQTLYILNINLLAYYTGKFRHTKKCIESYTDLIKSKHVLYKYLNIFVVFEIKDFLLCKIYYINKYKKNVHFILILTHTL